MFAKTNFTVNGLWLFLTVSWVCLQCVILVFPDHTHLLFSIFRERNKIVFFLFFLLQSVIP